MLVLVDFCGSFDEGRWKRKLTSPPSTFLPAYLDICFLSSLLAAYFPTIAAMVSVLFGLVLFWWGCWLCSRLVMRWDC